MTGWIEDAGSSVPAADVASLPLANCSGDIFIQWDNLNAQGDWTLVDGDLQTGQDLETACLVSLFTDKLATPDFVPTDGTSDRRGWWADPYIDQPRASNLWQLERAKKTRATLGLARRYAEEALQWLVDDGIAKEIVVNTGWLGAATSTLLGIGIAIVKPDGSVSRFTFGWAWQSLAVLASPVQVPPPPLQRARAMVR